MSELRGATYAVKIKVDGKEELKNVTVLTKNYDGTLQKLQDAMGNVTVAEKTKANTEREAARTVRALSNEYLKQQKALDTVVSEYENMNKSLTMTAKGQEIFNAQVRAGVDPLSKEGKQIANLVSKNYELAKSQNAMQKSMRGARGAAQNFGWQLQDTVVQMQMGTDAFVVLSQQGSQMAASFGAMGALIGAGIAIAGAGIPALLSSLGGLNRELDELIDKNIDKLKAPSEAEKKAASLRAELVSVEEEYARVAKGRLKFEKTGYGASDVKLSYGEVDTERLAELALRKEAILMAMKEINEEAAGGFDMQAFRDQMNIAEKEMLEGADAAKIMSMQIELGEKGWKAYGDEITRLITRNGNLKTSLEDQADAITAVDNALKQANKAGNKAPKSSSPFSGMSKMNSIEADRNKLKQLSESIAAAKEGLSDIVDVDKYMEASNKIAEAEAAYREADLANTKAYVEARKLLGEQLVSTVAGQAEQLTSTLMGAAEEGSSTYKALFALNQAFAIADGTLKAYTTAVNVREGVSKLFPENIAAQEAAFGTSLAIGMANVGAIAGVAFAGAFDKGGMIPSGQAGLVSEFGDEIIGNGGGTLVYNNSGSPLPVTGREQTAKLMGGQGGQTIVQNITVSGNGDAALIRAMRTAAKQGADQAYARVQSDFKNDRGISKRAARR